MSTIAIENKLSYSKNTSRNKYISYTEPCSDWMFKSKHNVHDSNQKWSVIEPLTISHIEILPIIKSPKLFYTKKNFEIETLEGTFNLDEKLQNIYDIIQQSKVLLSYENDWDEEGAMGCNEIVYDRAINLLIKYSQNVFRYHNISIEAPEINLGRDGSIDLEWRCEKSIFLITVLNSAKFDVHFYGDDNGTILKGTLTDYKINRFLSFWMRCLV